MKFVMETTIRPLAVLIFIAICMLAALISDAGRSSFMGMAAFAQGPGNSGTTGDTLTDRDIERMSAMGQLAHLAGTGQLGSGMAKVATADGGQNGVAGGHAQPSI